MGASPAKKEAAARALRVVLAVAQVVTQTGPSSRDACRAKKLEFTKKTTRSFWRVATSGAARLLTRTREPESGDDGHVALASLGSRTRSAGARRWRLEGLNCLQAVAANVSVLVLLSRRERLETPSTRPGRGPGTGRSASFCVRSALSFKSAPSFHKGPSQRALAPITRADRTGLPMSTSSSTASLRASSRAAGSARAGAASPLVVLRSLERARPPPELARLFALDKFIFWRVLSRSGRSDGTCRITSATSEQEPPAPGSKRCSIFFGVAHRTPSGHAAPKPRYSARTPSSLPSPPSG